MNRKDIFLNVHASAKHIEDYSKTLQLLVERELNEEFSNPLKVIVFERDLVMTLKKISDELMDTVNSVSVAVSIKENP